MVKITQEPSRGDELLRIGQGGDIQIMGRDESIGTEAGAQAAEINDDVAAGGGERRERRREFEIRNVIQEAVAIPLAGFDDLHKVEVEGVVTTTAFEDQNAWGRAAGEPHECAVGDGVDLL